MSWPKGSAAAAAEDADEEEEEEEEEEEVEEAEAAGKSEKDATAPELCEEVSVPHLIVAQSSVSNMNLMPSIWCFFRVFLIC